MNGSVEARLAALEAEVAELRTRVQKTDRVGWQRFVGAFRGDVTFKKAMKEGRKFRAETARQAGSVKKP